MRIDLHVHVKERSPCGKSGEVDQVDAAIAAGLDAIWFTDHNRLAPAGRIVELNARGAPFRVFGGIELHVEGEDLLVLGIHDRRLETEAWTYPALHRFVRERQGFLALAHPFRYHPDIQLPLEEFKPDGIEVASRNTPPQAFERISGLARDLGMAALSNSDAHAAEGLGRHYNVLNDHAADERAVLDMLRKGLFSRVMPPL